MTKEVQEKRRSALNLEKNKELTGKTAKALQNSQNDRTDDFLSLKEIKDSINEDITNQALVNQLINEYLSSFSVFPFYTYREASGEAIDDIVVGDSLKFIVTSAKESPLAFNEDSFFAKDEKKDTMAYLIGPKDYKKYGQIRDMTLLKQGSEEFILTAHGDGKIWKWKPGTMNTPDPIYQFTGRDTLIQEMAVAGDYLLVAVDSIVYELNLKSKNPVARHILGFNRDVKILVADPKNNGQFAVVKENSNEILICQTNTINTIVDSYIQDLSAVTSLADNSASLYELNNNSIGSLIPKIRLEGINPDFSGHTSDVNVVAFAHKKMEDGSYRFTTGSADKTGKIWEFKNGSIKELPSVIRHQDEITVAGFLPGDSLIVTGGFDETLRIWRAGEVEKLIAERVAKK